METDPNKINDKSEDRMSSEFQEQIDSRILKTGEEYAASNKRQRAENKVRAENRNKIKELGISTHAYQIAVKVVKDLTAGERADWIRDFQMVVKVLGARQAELFPDEALKAEQRAQRKAEKAAGQPRSKEELDAASDANPKSDPAAGGAQIDIEAAIAEATARDAAEGDAILAGKSEAWRLGYNAQGAGAQRGDSPMLEGSAEARDWLAGFTASSERTFEAAAPAVPDPVMVDGQTYHDAAPAADAPAEEPAPAKKSQSAKAAEKRQAAQLPN